MTLNIANVDKLISKLETISKDRFTMRWIFLENGKMTNRVIEEHQCGTAACIAGWCALVAGWPKGEEWSGVNAERWLGMSRRDNAKLFMPSGFRGSLEIFPLPRALDVLRHLRDTGEVDWDRFPAANYRQPPAASKPARTPPVVIAIEPRLPESLTGLLRQPVETVDG